MKLVAQRRHRTGKGVARQLRRAGMLPAVLYGHGDSITVTVSHMDFSNIHRSGRGDNTILNFELQGEPPETCNAMLREVQINPLTGRPVHADFYRVDMHQPITVTVSLEFTNVPENRLRAAQAWWLPLWRELEVTCLPGDIPESITVDLTELDVGATVVAGSLTLPPEVTLAVDAEETLVTTTTVVAEAADGGAEIAAGEETPEE